jgi:hypothetical protein
MCSKISHIKDFTSTASIETKVMPKDLTHYEEIFNKTGRNDRLVNDQRKAVNKEIAVLSIRLEKSITDPDYYPTRKKLFTALTITAAAVAVTAGITGAVAIAILLTIASGGSIPVLLIASCGAILFASTATCGLSITLGVIVGKQIRHTEENDRRSLENLQTVAKPRIDRLLYLEEVATERLSRKKVEELGYRRRQWSSTASA